MLSLVSFEISLVVETVAGQAVAAVEVEVSTLLDLEIFLVVETDSLMMGLKNREQLEMMNFSPLIVEEILKLELENCAFQLDKSALIVSNLFRNYL